MSKLSLVVMNGQGIPKPGVTGTHSRYESFKDELYDMTWNPDANAISLKDKATGALRIVSTSACLYWDPVVAAKVEGKK